MRLINHNVEVCTDNPIEIDRYKEMGFTELEVAEVEEMAEVAEVEEMAEPKPAKTSRNRKKVSDSNE